MSLRLFLSVHYIVNNLLFRTLLVSYYILSQQNMKRDKRRPNIEGGRDVNIIHISKLVILKLTLHQYIVIVV